MSNQGHFVQYSFWLEQIEIFQNHLLDLGILAYQT